MLDSFLRKTQNNDTIIEWILGIDEAGRGPIAGPVSVGGALIPADFDAGFFVGIKDSKQLSAELREEWLSKMHDHPSIHISVAMVGADHIDRRGIVHAIKTGMRRVLSDLTEDLDPKTILVLLDGSLYAPRIYVNQETIIKGDEKIPVISMASIAAKVTRDRHMVKLAKKYPEYQFERHKGYGTKGHYAKVHEHGPSDIHRSSFLKLTK